MPSYRVTLVVGTLRPGVDPSVVLPAAATSARERTTVEASEVAVVRGEARVSIRFLADDDQDASAIARRVRATVTTLAEVDSPTLHRRFGPRWHRVRVFSPSY